MQKGPSCQLFIVTSTNVGISSQKFLTFSFYPFTTLVYNFQFISSATSKTTPQEKWFFLSNPYKIEVMITSPIEMLELPNYDHMTTYSL